MSGISARTALAGAAACVSLAPMCHAQWWWPPTNGTLMNPSCPSPMSPIWLGISGNFPDTCVPAGVAVARTSTDIDLILTTTTPAGGCQQILYPWALVASLGPLPQGTYAVYATYVRDGVVTGQRTLVRTISVSPTCPAQCYPNCDGSTSAPVLNISDFTCYVQKFAAGDLYANCDGSSSAPVLNVSDFTCFLQRYASGCH